MGAVGTGGGGGGVVSVDCGDFYTETIINSPNALFLESLEEADILDVALSESDQIMIYDDDANPIGSITPDNMANLIDCLDSGYNYIAIVEEIDGGYCRVSVQPASEI